MAIFKYGHCLSELFCAVTAFGRFCASVRTLLVDVAALYLWAKLSGDCFCSTTCMLYSRMAGFAASAFTAIKRN